MKAQALHELDPPNPGTGCFTCSYLFNHWCQARTWYFEVPVCSFCLDRIPCPVQIAVIRMLNPGQDWKISE